MAVTSCGASKKLETTTAEITNLNSQLQNFKTESNKEISQLKAENIQYGKEAADSRIAKEAITRRWENLNNALVEKGKH